eukprot:SAG31_NODE_5069_length_2761_cov_11.750699_3_plen_182_part_00
MFDHGAAGGLATEGALVEMELELECLRERVRQLESQNAQLLRQNAQLRIAAAAGGSRRTPSGTRRVENTATALASGAGTQVLVEAAELDDDMPFANGKEIPLDQVGTALYIKAKTLMPQGCGLISKRPETFLPDRWPAYYERAQGPFVWDLSGNKYLDFCCSPGPYALGAADPDVRLCMAK